MWLEKHEKTGLGESSPHVRACKTQPQGHGVALFTLYLLASASFFWSARADCMLTGMNRAKRPNKSFTDGVFVCLLRHFLRARACLLECAERIELFLVVTCQCWSVGRCQSPSILKKKRSIVMEQSTKSKQVSPSCMSSIITYDPHLC